MNVITVNRKIEAVRSNCISTHLGWKNSSLHFLSGNLSCCKVCNVQNLYA